MPDGPLHGIRILDLTQALAGPFASMILADLGADVIKIEPPAGDMTRSTPPYYVGDTSVYFISNNRNKRGIVLDLKSAEGLKAFYDLARVSDVVFCNFSAGVVERLKIDPATLEGINPRIVTCNITGYGREGSEAGRRAVDLIVQSVAGAMSITGEAGGKPARAGVATADLSTALYSVIGILAALRARDSNSRASHVETSLFHSQLSLLNYVGSYCLHSGEIPQPVGSGHPGTVPSQAFETADGWVTIDAGFNRHFEILCGLLGFPDLPRDPRFRDRPSRAEHRAALLPQLGEVIRKKTTAQWIAELDAAGVPCGPVNNVKEAMESVQSRQYSAVRPLKTSNGESVDVLATPVWIDGVVKHPMRSAPDLGEHTADVLRDLLGYSDAAISRLSSAGKT